MRQILSFLGLLLTSKFNNYRTPLYGVEDLDVTASGELVMTRKLQLGSKVEDEFYFPEHGKLVRVVEGSFYTFQEQREEH